MKTKIIEVTQGSHLNWGKFLVGRMDVEWKRRSLLIGRPEHDPNPPLLRQVGWGRDHLWVLDLQTGEGVCVLPGGSAPNDLEKHSVWVCPMFEPFLAWLYRQDLSDLDALPDSLELSDEDAPFEWAGYRRSGQGVHFAVDENPCTVGWSGCDSYTGGHLCVRPADHPGAHLCGCGVTKQQRSRRVVQDSKQD